LRDRNLADKLEGLLTRERASAHRGLALSSGALLETTKIIGRDELTVPRLAEALPVPTEGAEDVLEKIVGTDERLNIMDAVARILLAARAVAHITGRRGSGTGFLIQPGLVMTNNHVLVGSENERTATEEDTSLTVTFNYEQDLSGGLATIAQFKTNPERFFAADRDLDFAVVAVDGEPEKTYGFLPLPAADDDISLAAGDDVFIVQHPNGGPKQIALAGNLVEYVDERVVQYTTDTLPGSSGAPVFNWQWRVVALHHSGGDIPEPNTNRTHFRNEGVLLRAILATIQLPAR